jgi:hypothetical protein
LSTLTVTVDAGGVAKPTVPAIAPPSVTTIASSGGPCLRQLQL